MVGVAQDVAHPAQAFPIWTGAKSPGLIAQALSSFGDDLHLALDCGLRSDVGLIGIEIHPFEEHLYMLSRMSRRWFSASLKGKDRLLKDPVAH